MPGTVQGVGGDIVYLIRMKGEREIVEVPEHEAVFNPELRGGVYFRTREDAEKFLAGDKTT
jgi:hypothetical protein